MTHCRSPRATAGSRLLSCLALFGAGGLACSAENSELKPEAGEELPGGETTTLVAVGQNAFIRPLENLLSEHRPWFFTGDSLFDQAWVEPPSSTSGRDGLGPLYNARSCSSCHPKDGRGAPPEPEDAGFGGLLLRLSIPGTDEHGGPVGDPSYGGQLQPYAVNGVPEEASQRLSYTAQAGVYADGESYELLVPEYVIDDPQYGPFADELMVSPRVGPAMIGLGLLEAIADERLLELADPEDDDGDGISGKVNRVWEVATQSVALGRFGWKAGQPSLRQQSAGAFQGDLGVTSSLFPGQGCTSVQLECEAEMSGGEPELSDRLLDRVELYMRALAVPLRLRYAEPEVLEGKRLFGALGCADCHVASHRTQAAASLEELSDQLIWPYTDLLLHDLGDELADNRPIFEASGSEWRTPPLWGIGRYQAVNGHERLMHDGRARGVAEAILWHGGEADASRQGFVEASAEQRAAVVSFVRSL